MLVWHEVKTMPMDNSLDSWAVFLLLVAHKPRLKSEELCLLGALNVGEIEI
jgi:hypothetical protein